MPPANKPILCYVTDRRTLPVRGPEYTSEKLLLRAIERAAALGADWIQIREKDLSGAGLAALVREVIQLAGNCRVIVNDRLDLALATRAKGVHLGEASLPLAAAVRAVAEARARGVVSADFLVGASVHSLEGAMEAERCGASYAFYGPVFATPAKAPYGAPQGLERLRAVCNAVKIPVLAIGGITADNARDCFECGSAGVAAIRMFQDSGISELQI